MFSRGRGLAECRYYSVNLVWGQVMSVLPLVGEFNPPISCAIFTKEKKKKDGTHCTAPIPKTSLTIHFFSYVLCTLGHKHGGNSWVVGCDFSLFAQFPFHLSFYSSTFFPLPLLLQKNRSLSLLSSLCTFHPSRSWNSQNIPLSPYWTTSLFSTPSLLKILLYLTYFSHRLIHSFFLLRISYFQFIFCYTPFAVYGQCYFPLCV